MALYIGIALTLLSLLVLASPFFRKTTASQTLRQLRSRREAIYQEIKVLQNDLALGHMSQEEYESRIRENRLQAAEILREDDHLAEAEKRLENEILRMRRTRGAAKERWECPNCGASAEDGEAACLECSTALVERASDNGG